MTTHESRSPVREVQITFDALDPIPVALFWAEVLGYVVEPVPGEPIDPEVPATEVVERWMRWLSERGVPEEHRRGACALVHPEGAGPRLFFQRVPEDKAVKNRVHLDVRAALTAEGTTLQGDPRMAALEAEAARLVALGATRVERFEPDGGMSAGFIVMRDVEQNEFCLD